MGAERRNDNFTPSLSVKSNAGDDADVVLWADPTTHRLLVTVTGAGSGGTSAIDDSAFVAATDAGTPIMGFVTADTVDAGDVGVLGMTADRSLHVYIKGSDVATGGTSATDDSAFTAAVGSGTPMMGFATADVVDSGDVGVLAMTVERALHVYIKGSDVSSGGTSMVDDAAFTPGTTSGTPAFAVFDDTTPDSVDEGDGGALRMSANRNLYVRLRDNAGNERGLNIDANGALAATVTNVTAANLNAQVVGSVAHDAVGTGTNPLLVGGYASAAAPTSVSADGDAVRAWYLLNGAQATVVTAAGALIGGDATNGLDVDVTRVIPGTTATALGKAEDAAHTSGDTGVMALAVRRDTAAASSGTTGDYEPLSTDALGKMWCADNQTEDLAHTTGDRGSFVLAVRSDTLAATSGTTGDYEGLHTDALGALWTRDTTVLADDAAFTPATSRVMPVGFFADETATDSVDEGDTGAARMTLDRKQIVAAYAHTAGGATAYKLVSAATTNATSVKASAGQLYMVTASNVNAAVRYLKLYNKASAPTVGTDVPVFTFAIPGNTAGAGTNIPIPACGIAFGTGIAFALTTEATDAGTTAVAANEIVVNLAYL